MPLARVLARTSGTARRSTPRQSAARLFALALVVSCGSSEPAAPEGSFSFYATDLSPQTPRPGDSAALTLVSAFQGGFSDHVVFGLEGPVGFSASFNPCQTVLVQQPFGPSPGVTCNVIVRVDSSVTPGSHGLRFAATTARLPPKRITVTVSVAAPRPLPQTFSVTASTRDLTLVRGDSADVVLVLSPRPPGADDVTFTGMPTYVGVALSWVPSSSVPAGTDTVRLRFKTTPAAVVRSHSFFIEARLPGRPAYTILLTLQVVAESAGKP